MNDVIEVEKETKRDGMTTLEKQIVYILENQSRELIDQYDVIEQEELN